MFSLHNLHYVCVRCTIEFGASLYFISNMIVIFGRNSCRVLRRTTLSALNHILQTC